MSAIWENNVNQVIQDELGSFNWISIIKECSLRCRWNISLLCECLDRNSFGYAALRNMNLRWHSTWSGNFFIKNVIDGEISHFPFCVYEMVNGFEIVCVCFEEFFRWNFHLNRFWRKKNFVISIFFILNSCRILLSGVSKVNVKYRVHFYFKLAVPANLISPYQSHL